MESLLLVLLVIGVVMILAGLARMRNKQRRVSRWDDIDHSVLFNKGDGDMADIRLETEDRDPPLGDDLEGLGELVAADVGDVADEMSPTIEKRRANAADDVEKNRPIQTSFPFLGRGRREDGKHQDAAKSSAVKFFKDGAPQWVIVVNVMAPDASPFQGRALLGTLESLGLTLGDMDIFHFRKNGVPQFSVANMVKPGTFDPAHMAGFSTPGISLFVQLPNQFGSGMTAFNHMLDTAHQIAAQLGGEVRDERRSVLTSSAVDHVREKIVEYELKWRVAD